MRLKYLLFSLALLLGLNTFAANTQVSESYGLLWIVITAIAALALIITVINVFRITKIKKVLEANYENTRDDMDLSFRKMKSSLQRDIKNIRREVNKNRENNGLAPKKQVKNVESTQDDTENKAVKKRPQNRRYNPKKKKNTENKGEKRAE